MNRAQLAEILELLEVRPTTYELNGDPSNYESHCLSDEQDGWHVYFFERGIRSSEVVCRDEDDACVTFLKRVAGDPWTRGAPCGPPS